MRTDPGRLIYGDTFAFGTTMTKKNLEGEDIADWRFLDNDSHYDTTNGVGVIKLTARRRLPSEEAPYYDWAIGNQIPVIISLSTISIGD